MPRRHLPTVLTAAALAALALGAGVAQASPAALYVADQGTSRIYQYSVDGAGVLAPLTTPFVAPVLEVVLLDPATAAKAKTRAAAVHAGAAKKKAKKKNVIVRAGKSYLARKK